MTEQNTGLRHEVEKLLRDIDSLRTTATALLEKLEPEDDEATMMDFMSRCAVQHPIKGAVPFELYQYQRDMLKKFDENRLTVTACARQLGKTSVTAMYALYLAATRPDYTVVIVGPNLRHGQGILDILRYSAEHGTNNLPFVTESNKHTLGFSNGSKIMVRACHRDSIRGLTVDCLIMDEAAHVSYKTIEDFWTSALPLLVRNTKVIMTSTPRYKEGLFYQIFTKAPANDFVALRYTWYDHPDRDAKWGEFMRNQCGTDRFKCEHEARFIDAP